MTVVNRTQTPRPPPTPAEARRTLAAAAGNLVGGPIVGALAAAAADQFAGPTLEPQPRPFTNFDIFAGGPQDSNDELGKGYASVNGEVNGGKDFGTGMGHVGIEAGKPLEVYWAAYRYDLMTDSNGQRFSGPASNIAKVEMEYIIDGERYPPVQVARPHPTASHLLEKEQVTLDIPADAKGQMKYWFKATTVDGKEYYDSRRGEDYHVNVIPRAGGTITFDNAMGETVEGTLKAGDSVSLRYDARRLTRHLNGTSRHYQLNAWVKFVKDNGTEDVKRITLSNFKRDAQGNETPELEMVEPRVEIPTNARRMEVWFDNYISRRGPTYDSGADEGIQNYKFNIER